MYCPLQTDDISEGKSWCNRALSSDPENLDVLCDLAEIYINDEDYDEAIKTYQKASQLDNQYQRVCMYMYMTLLYLNI